MDLFANKRQISDVDYDYVQNAYLKHLDDYFNKIMFKHNKKSTIKRIFYYLAGDLGTLIVVQPVICCITGCHKN